MRGGLYLLRALRALHRTESDIPHHSGRDLHIGRRRIGISSTHDPDSQIQHHVNGISIQLGYHQGWRLGEGQMRRGQKEDKDGQSNNS